MDSHTQLLYRSISNDIDAQAKSFKIFLRTFVLDDEGWKTFNEISKTGDIYIFSGIIRDFLTGEFDGIRDFDLVLGSKIPRSMLVIDYLRHSDKYRKNNFGGMKISHKNLNIDIWYLKDTWGIKSEHYLPTPEALIKTAFFNFSAIVYDYNAEKFIYDRPFLSFLLTKTMDIVYTKNPNIPLCLVNIYYYQKKYNYTISERMVKWIKENYSSSIDLMTIQNKHFGRIIATNDQLTQFYNHLLSSY